MKFTLVIIFLLSLSGCADTPDSVLSSLLAGVAYLSVGLFFIVIGFFLKGVKFLVSPITKENNKEKEKNWKKKYKVQLKNDIKDLQKLILEDRRFIKSTYKQYINRHKRMYPETKYPRNKVPNAYSYLSNSGWNNQKKIVIQRLKSYEEKLGHLKKEV